jgi:hypothetical protein
MRSGRAPCLELLGWSGEREGEDPTKAQDYDFSIPTTPVYSTTTTAAPLGSIGMIISGAVLFNPYEGDNSTVAMSNNFYLTDTDGTKVHFVDTCSGHPTPVGEYHYQTVSSCVTIQVDTSTGPSHLIGAALDGFPIYGSRDVAGNEIATSSLDECNGITSVTPEFPNGFCPSFLDANGAQVGASATIGPVTPAMRGNQTKLMLRSTSGPVPARARSATVQMCFGVRTGGTTNDGYADNLKLGVRAS